MTRVELVQQQADRLLDHTLPTFDRAVLAIPPERLEFRPTPENMTAKGMAHHVYQIVQMTALGVKAGEVTREDLGALPLDLASVQRPEQLVEWGRQLRQRARAVLGSLSDETLDRPVRYFFGLTASGYDSVLNATEEVLHHRGQMQLYLRLMGVKPPGIRDPL